MIRTLQPTTADQYPQWGQPNSTTAGQYPQWGQQAPPPPPPFPQQPGQFSQSGQNFPQQPGQFGVPPVQPAKPTFKQRFQGMPRWKRFATIGCSTLIAVTMLCSLCAVVGNALPKSPQQPSSVNAGQVLANDRASGCTNSKA